MNVTKSVTWALVELLAGNVAWASEAAPAGGGNAAAITAFQAGLRKKLDRADKPNLGGRFKADFESLKQYKIPDWYQDAKFGIFIHWGIFSAPAINDCWYGYCDVPG